MGLELVEPIKVILHIIDGFWKYCILNHLYPVLNKPIQQEQVVGWKS